MEYLGGKPLCMNQYYQILSSCRVPGPKQDSVVNFSKTKKPPMHITVVHNYQVGAPGGLSPHAAAGEGQDRKSASPARVPMCLREQACPGHLQWVPGLRETRRGRGPAQPGESHARASSQL